MGHRGFDPRPCPVCRATGATLLFQQSFEQLSGAGFLDGYDVVVCRNCGAGFADDIPQQPVFDAYYRDQSKYDNATRAVAESPFEKARLLEIARNVEPFIAGRDSRILEPGCGSGKFLGVLRQAGFTSVLGLDPSPECARAARDLYGVPVMKGTIASVPEPPEPYDFLILLGVMEHIRDLDPAVAQLHRLLRDGGRVYLETPDARRFVSRQDAPFQEFSIEHINFFSARSLSGLMQRRGFREVATGHATRPQYEVTAPALYGVWEKTAQTAVPDRDTETEETLRAYIRGCRSEDSAVRTRIEQALVPGERMIVWGVGTHTLRLLATGGLDPERIALFVDSNPNYQEKRLRGVPVVSPSELKARREPILVSSRSFQREIHNQIRHKLGLDNRVILLYE